MTDPTGDGRPEKPLIDEGRPLWVWIAGATVAAVGVGGGMFFGFGALTGHGWWPWSNPPENRPDLYEVTRSAVAGAALVAAAVAGAITIRRQRSTEDSVRISAGAQKVAAEAQLISAQTYERETQKQEAEVVSRLRDRYTTAAGQLGHDAPAVRLAGAYALATLADEWLARAEATAGAEAQTCIDLLCAYMRTPGAAPSAGDDVETAADREVRQSIIRIITAHLQEDAHTSWSGVDLDFTGADFAGTYTFRGANFSTGSVSFDRSQFLAGSVSFDGAKFLGGTVSFYRVNFSAGSVSFDGANFLAGSVDFDRSHFSGGVVSFNDAQFSGGVVSFDGAEFSAGILAFLRAEFSGGRASFRRGRFSGATVGFEGAQFTGASVTFGGAQFTGASVTFGAAQFANGGVGFDMAGFSGGHVTFGRAQFSGGHVTFAQTVAEGGIVSGPWANDQLLPSVWPGLKRS